MKRWPFVVAAGIGVLAATGAALGAVDLNAEPEETPEPEPLCDYLNGHFADFDPPIDAADARPLAVLDSPHLGVAIDRIDRGLPPDEDPLVNAIDVMAGFYAFPVRDIGAANLADSVTIPNTISEDYSTYANALYSAIYEHQPDVRDDPDVRQAAQTVDDYVATCNPPLGNSRQ